MKITPSFKRRVFEAIDSLPPGTVFSARDLVPLVKRKHADVANVSKVIKEYPGLIEDAAIGRATQWKKKREDDGKDQTRIG